MWCLDWGVLWGVFVVNFSFCRFGNWGCGVSRNFVLRVGCNYL